MGCCTSQTCRGGGAQHPSELFKVNDEIDVTVLKFDPDTERVSLGHKQLHDDPGSPRQTAIRSDSVWRVRS